MAKRRITGNLAKTLSTFNTKREAEEKKYDPAKQSAGIEKRLEASGIDATKASDNRSIFEKAFNLPDDQNVIFDIFEVMNRPQQALFGGVMGALEGDGFGKGALEGLKGNKDTMFKDISNEIGLTEETDGTFGIDDVVGFAGDVLLDPLDWAIPGSSLATKFNKLDEIGDATKAAARASEELAVYVANGSVDFATIKSGVDKTYDGLLAAKVAAQTTVEEVAEKGARMSQKNRNLRQIAFQNMGSGFKGMLKFSDNNIEKVLTWVDARAVKDLKNPELYKPILEAYQGLKSSLVKTFDMASALPKGFMQKFRGIKGKQEFTADHLARFADSTEKAISKNLDDLVIKIEKTSGKPIGRKKLQDLVAIIYEYDLIDEAGKVDLGKLNKMSKPTSLTEVMTSSKYMLNLGLTDVDKDAIETFARVNMPTWYADNITNGSHPLFIKSELGGQALTDDTWRISKKALLDGEEGLIQAYNKIKNLDLDKRVDMFDSQIKKGIKAEDFKEYKRYKDLQENISKFEELKASGKRFTVPEGSPFVKNYITDMNHIKGLRDKEDAAKDIVEKLRAKQVAEDSPALKKAMVRYEKAKQRVADQISKRGKLLEDFDKNKVRVTEVLNNMKKDIQRIEATGIKDKFEVVENFVNDGAKKLNLNTPLNEQTKSLIEELVGENYLDDIKTINAGYHDFYSTIAKTISDSFGTAYFEDVYTTDYLRHTLSKDWINSQFDALEDSVMGTGKLEAKKASDLIGSGKTFGARKWADAAPVANEQARAYLDYLKVSGAVTSDEGLKILEDAKNAELFTKDLKATMSDMVFASTKTTADAQVYRLILESVLLPTPEELAKTGRNKTDFIRVMADARDIGVPSGFVAVESRELAKKVQDLSGYFRKTGETAQDMQELNRKLKNWLDSAEGKKIFIDKNIDRMIGRVSGKTEQSSFLRLMDSMNTVFKKFKLLSPGFQVRNIFGNTSNMWLSGMSSKDVAKYTGNAYSTLNKAPELLKKVELGGVLTDAEKIIVKNYQEFSSVGFGHMRNNLNDLDIFQNAPKNKNGVDKLIDFNMRKNQEFDLYARYALFTYAKDNPNWVRDSGYADAVDAVRHILFDYSELSANETDYIKRLVPFYTFTKKNLAQQIRNLGKNSTRYSNLMKTYNSLWESLDLEEDQIEQYKRESFWIPIPKLDKNGEYMAIKASLPIGDLGEFLSNPVQRAVSSTAPVVRAPFEMAVNRQAFSGMPISEFKGQKGYQIPEISKELEYALNQVGLDVPVSGAMNLGRSAYNMIIGNEDDIGNAMYEGLGQSFLSKGSPEKAAERAAYDRLDELQNLMRLYKQQGVDIESLKSINNREKFNSMENRIRQIRALRQKKRP